MPTSPQGPESIPWLVGYFSWHVKQPYGLGLLAGGWQIESFGQDDCDEVAEDLWLGYGLSQCIGTDHILPEVIPPWFTLPALFTPSFTALLDADVPLKSTKPLPMHPTIMGAKTKMKNPPVQVGKARGLKIGPEDTPAVPCPPSHPPPTTGYLDDGSTGWVGTKSPCTDNTKGWILNSVGHGSGPSSRHDWGLHSTGFCGQCCYPLKTGFAINTI